MRPNDGRSITYRTLGAFVAAGFAAAITACSDSSGPHAAHDVSLSFATMTSLAAGAGQTSSTAGPGGTGALVVRDASHTLAITRAEVVLSELELATTTAAPCVSDDDDRGDDHGGRHHDDSCARLELGPILVDLPVDSSVVTVLSLAIPAGSYAALEAKLRPASDDDDSGAIAFRGAHPELERASVRVEGTFDGTPFVYLGAPRGHVEMKFDPPLDVSGGAANITVHVALDRWFMGANGALIDPATAQQNGPNAEAVANNIRRAFHAFRDDDRRGDDHGRNRGEGGG
jgi:hypothetical protein